MEPQGWPDEVLGAWESAFCGGSHATASEPSFCTSPTGHIGSASQHSEQGGYGADVWGGSTAGAPKDVMSQFGCLVLRDACVPGFPSFPVIGVAHLGAMDGTWLPDFYINQGGFTQGSRGRNSCTVL
jgi:hypothetical protein